MTVSVDEVLSQIGGYGKYQILMLMLVGFIDFGLSSFNVMIITFIAGEPTWECVSNSTVCNITGIVDTTSDDYNARCDMPRSEWKFSDTFTSTVTEFELVCDKSILQNVSSSLFWLGWLIGNLVFGHIADKIGRRKAILLGVFATSVVSWVIVWPRYLSVYIICRILTGVSCAGASMTSFVLLVEYSGVKHRSWAGTNIWYFGSVCFMFLSLLAYLIREWRYLMLYGACVSVLVLMSTWFLPESCRYLLVNNRHDEAVKQLEKVGRWNGKPMPKVELEEPKRVVHEKTDVRDLFYDKNVAKVTIASWITWFVCALVYYVVSYGAIYLGGNIYLNFFLVSLATVPSTFTSIVCMNKFGRRKAIVGGMVISAVASVIAVSIPSNRQHKGYTAGRIIMAMVCKYANDVSFNTAYIISSELFPTSVRSIGLGTSSACARIGSFLALYVVWLIRIHHLLPYAIVVALCVTAGFTCFKFLPETISKPTRESMEAVLEMGSKNVEELPLNENETQTEKRI
ncbi:organic cation transporter protein-like [Dendronephthya gigantea]|uniref:organic cation transporter protein-like n=1 Tax=Dendronephthya gigantea TaxID=151771 RepID=UPI00106BC990|nr:organic cation transporter protein-like [Dendronephthya gigantea]